MLSTRGKGATMNVRIISGIYGGRIIDAPGRSTTHAMSERARNALFNSLGDQIHEKTVLDAFAGSGSLGIEALSRGAKSAVFVEKDRIAAKIIQKNIETLGITDQSKVVRAGVASWIETSQSEQFDLIFADPPYTDMQLSTVFKLFALLKVGGTMILSHPGNGEVPNQHGIVVVDNRSYGSLHLTYFQKTSE
jgi:16S rRNA (guanine966-N2)-methyltransferase